MRRVGEVERFHPELHSYALREGELAEQAEVPICQARPAQKVAAGVPETCLVDISERGRVIIRSSPPKAAQFYHLRFYLIRILRASRQVQRRVFCVHTKWRPANKADC